MKVILKEIENQDEKSKICGEILRALPEWFGVEKYIVDYVKQVKGLPFFVALLGDEIIGFITIKRHNNFTAEIYVMGIDKKYHRQGIGKLLYQYCESFCIKNKFEFLTVKTLDNSAEYEPFERTRQFYSKMGFKPLEIFPTVWDKENPCLVMIKHLRGEL